MSRITSENGYSDIKQSIRDKIDSLKLRLSFFPGQQEPSGDINSYLESLIAIARKSEIQFVRMQPQEEQQNNDISLHPVLLVFTATYHELGAFIAALEKMPHQYHIDRLALDATAGGKCDVKLLLSFLLPAESKND